MRTVALTAIGLVVLLGVGTAVSQEITTDIYPSEDEIFDALITEEITYEQYLILQEIITFGVDSTNRHLLDEIPNLSFFNLDSVAIKTSLETEQQAPFEDQTGQPKSASAVSGVLRQEYATYADESGRSRSVSRGQFRIGEAVTVDAKLRRDYSGSRYWMGRTVKFQHEGTVREVIVGNFSRRFGLGTVFGHRGKLFRVSNDLNAESFLFPEYGGQNGALTKLAFGGYELSAMMSVRRSELTRVSSWGGMFNARNLPLRPTVVWGVTQLKNRQSGQQVEDTKIALTSRHDYRAGYGALELCWQMGESEGFAAAVTEGRHRFQLAEIRWAGWYYDDGYIDLTGGSKAAAMYHSQVFEDIERDFSSKRFGQQGVMVKTVVNLTDRVKLANSLLYASFNSDTVSTQWLAQVSRRFGKLSLSVDFLSRGKTRGDDVTVGRKLKIVARWRHEKLYARSYIGYNSQTDRRDFLSIFADMKYKIDSLGEIELWTNISDFDHHAGRINHWYAYLKNSVHVAGSVTAGMKLGHTYRYGASEEHQTFVGLDLSCAF